MADVYTALAVNCPPLCVPATPLRVLAAGEPAPSTFEDLSTGTGEGDLGVLRRNAMRGAGLGRSGGGLWGIASGFDVVAGSGLNVAVTQGTLSFDGPVSQPLDPDGTGSPVTCQDNAYNWVYATRTGQAFKVHGTDPEDLPAFPDEYIFLKRVLYESGAPTEFDDSGVFRLAPDKDLDGQGNVWIRRTADYGPPTDTPPASARFYTQTASGLYLWDGAEHRLASEHRAETVSSSEAQYTAAVEQRRFEIRHTVRGRSVIRGRLVVRGRA